MHETLIPQITDPDARKAIFEALMALFDRWHLHTLNQVQLLGLVDGSNFLVDRELPDDPAVLERVGHLLAIDRALLKLHPYSETFRDHWIDRPEPAFDGISPLEIMLTNGSDGIKKVRELVESQAAKLQRS